MREEWRPRRGAPLSQQEAHVMGLLCEGHTQLQVGQKLNKDRGSVAVQLRRIRMKLGAATTVEAAVKFSLQRKLDANSDKC